MKQPLQRLRGEVIRTFQNDEFDLAAYDDFTNQLTTLVKQDFPELLPTLASEQQNIQHAFAAGVAPSEPNLGSPVTQLLWGAALGAIITDPEIRQDWPPFVLGTSLTKSRLWQQVRNHPLVNQTAAMMLLELRRLKLEGGAQNTFAWTAPGNGAGGPSFDGNTGKVRGDLMGSLISGLSTDPFKMITHDAHATAPLMREIAYGVGTQFPPEMQEIRQEMEAIKAKQGRTKEDHLALAKLAAEWQVRYDIHHASESNYANRFTANQSNYVNDYAYGLNAAEAIAHHGIATAAIDASPPTAVQRLAHLKRALACAFFKNHDFFPDTEAGWREMGVDPNGIAGREPGNSDEFRSGMAALNTLTALCQELEALQPKPRDRMMGASGYHRVLQECSQARCTVIQEIFDRFAASLLPEIRQQAEDRMKERMDEEAEHQGQGQEARHAVDREHEQPPDTDKTEQKEDRRGQRTVQVKDVGAMPEIESPPKSPAAMSRGGTGAEEEPKTLEELMDAAGSMDRPAGSDRRPEARGRPQPPPLIPKAEWSEYQQLLKPYPHVVRQARELFRKIAQRSHAWLDDDAERSEFFPEDEGIASFSVDAVLDRNRKLLTGQTLDVEDFKNFRLSSPQRNAAPPTLIHIVDVSGSMEGKPFEKVASLVAITNEGSKGIGSKLAAARGRVAEQFVIAMGDRQSQMIAKPGDSDQKIGQSLAALGKVIGGDKDYLAPSLENAFNAVANLKKPDDAPIGQTHIFVYSDGEFSDYAKIVTALHHLRSRLKTVTVDFCLTSPPAPELQQAIANGPHFGVEVVSSADDIPASVLRMLQKRALGMPKEAGTFAEKRHEIRRLGENLK